MIDRRAVVAGMAAAAINRPAGSQTTAARPPLEARLAALEAGIAGRLGVSILDTQNGRRWSHRAGERFPLCSTFKLLAAALVLARSDAGHESLQRLVRFGPEEIVPYSPATQDRADGPGMAVAEICAAAVTLSDNTAGNLMLDSFGGPGALTEFARTLGDAVTRLDRREPGLNEAKPGDLRDTTSPDAMVADLQALLLGDVLSPRSRAQLAAWLGDSRTGGAKLRAGLPAEWRVGDKTGAGENGTTNEVAILSRPDRKPVLAAIYLTETKASVDERNGVFAAIGQAIASTIGG